MVLKYVVLFFFGSAFALPTTPLIKLDPDNRYALVPDANGDTHMIDLWLSLDDLQEAAKYNAATDNVYHLFTRYNPWTSQPLLIGSNEYLALTNFDANKKTYFVIHGWMDDHSAPTFQHIIPAILEREDCNVIMVDWGAGAGTWNYAVVVTRTVFCGEHVAQVINWLLETTTCTSRHFSIIGQSLGGHIAGITGRNVNGDIASIIALDPSWPGFITNSNRFRADDAIYTEVIHTNSGVAGYLTPLGQVDFYPNGGVIMPGCSTIDTMCSHNLAYVYMAESIRSGGFTGILCNSYTEAMDQQCTNSTTLKMGGLEPKYGASGIYYLKTNERSPYSQG